MFLDNPENKGVVEMMNEKDDEQCMDEAKKNGREEGIKEGEKRAKLENAKKMLEEEITLEQVMRITGLTKEEIMEDMKK